ncbi:FtsB family cell division protein [Persicirhabdus sediminis]|uniref:Cell division protein FtsB n=1 Tax=Persicirhabdus sediminis TaxID=454144 RepID=A0A8J7SGV1_9BACT|nr:hypothetical protein [Persicirhabdus sediminis]MBK1790365.1 hypothetical protein [Persicirhabdus sediminis]
MAFDKHSEPYYASAGEFNRIQKRTAQMQAGVRLAVCLLVLVFCSAVFASAIPHYLKLQEMETELAEQKEREEVSMEKLDRIERMSRGIDEDPAYMELKGRDRLNLYKEGEKIFRFERQ